MSVSDRRGSIDGREGDSLSHPPSSSRLPFASCPSVATSHFEVACMAESSDGGSSGMSSKESTDELSLLLRQKQSDIEIAVQIGQSLLEKNEELLTKNEFLEESLAQAREQTEQLRHDLQSRIELLRFFSVEDDANFFGEGNTVATLGRQVERLRKENVRLTAEGNVLRKDIERRDSHNRRVIEEIESQLAIVTSQVTKLQAAISKKNEECAVQGESIVRLLEEVNRRSQKERDMIEEKDNIMEQLHEAIRREGQLADQMNTMQDMYTEVKAMFNDAEEELRAYRVKPSPYRAPSVDSLYDSLASELETSDSGRWTPRHRWQNPKKVKAEDEKKDRLDEENTPKDENLSIANELSAIQLPESNKQPEICGGNLTLDEEKEDSHPPDPIKGIEVLPPQETQIASTACIPLPEYLDGSTESSSLRAPTRSSSSNSLSDYEAPSLGEPGVPGTRDLRVSIRQKLRRQVCDRGRSLISACTPSRALENDFAAFRVRKGLRPRSFFRDGPSEENNSLLSHYLIGETRSILPWRTCSTVGLHGVRTLSGGGVLTRTELPPIGLPSPSSSPNHGALSSGLRFALQSFSPSGGIVLRRKFL